MDQTNLLDPLNRVLIFDLDDTLYARFGVVEEDGTGIENIELYPEAYDFLRKTNFKKVLVTKGDPTLQIQKINKLGIKDFFSLILICSTDLEKKSCFGQVKEKFPESEYWVIGDRIDSEIRYGNELGLKTVLLRKGKYAQLQAQDPSEIPTFEIQEFSQLSGVLDSECKQ